ncbi:hypothetical protein QQS21_000838 [Conoideocrella luteorostrata]|uniref:Bacteriocin-protection protein n=1 Tax=Conoideocrella luteorostrata TaxID=1105319 RepID=A0AAJ0G2G3_9HYPO|nr:hypothetical protein QQS21_000838 [Conoideocrella luteorostrata]
MPRRSTRLITKAAATPEAATLPAQSIPPPVSASTAVSPSTPKISIPSPSPQIIPFASSAAFDRYLQSHGLTTPAGIWLKIGKKSNPLPSISHDQAIDVALCHGWIDGQRKSLDADYFLQRFTPRRKNSMWSKRNVDKVTVLMADDKMQPAGMAEVNAAKVDGRWDRAYSGPATMEVPEDFAEALRANSKAGDVWATLGKTQRWPFLWRVVTVKREETRRRKIGEFMDMLARGETLR